MSKADEFMVSIVTVKFTAPKGWKPRTMTVRHAVIHRRKDSNEVLGKVEEQAEIIKKEYEAKYDGLELTHTVKMERTSVDLITVIGDDLKKKG
ncbi:MAG: hypothetical protein J5965_07800 [Aeriscardovia sp.]|nr:hypothetical protein [Prevotella sp.]MBO5628970.1 hypothetical protein [Aeriscardovia sp.]